MSDDIVLKHDSSSDNLVLLLINFSFKFKEKIEKYLICENVYYIFVLFKQKTLL